MSRIVSWSRNHLLIIIIGVATLTRLIGLDKIPPSLNWDEVSMGYSAYSLLHTGKDEWGETLPLLFRSYGEWKSPVYIYVLVPFIKLFGMNAWGVRLPVALAGIGVVYLTYLLGRKLYSDKVGLWASFLMAVSPWHLMLSRPAFEAGFSLMLVLLGLHLALNKRFILAALPWGLAIHTYHSAKFVVPVLAFYLGLTYLKKVSFKKMFIAAFILALFALPIALDLVSGKSQKRYAQVGITTDKELVERFYRYRQTFPLGDTLNKFIFNKYTFTLAKGFSNWTSYLSPHFLLGSESIRAQHSIPFRGVLYLTEFVLFLYGLTLLFKNYQGPARWLPLITIAVGFIPPALTKDIYHVLRSIMTLPWWQLIAAIGFANLSENKKFRKLYTLNFTFLLCEALVFLFMYFTWYPKAFAADWQAGYRELSTWLEANESRYDHIYMTKAYGEPHIFLAFYGKWDPVWYQEQNQKLIDYEAQGYPWLDQLPVYSLGKYTFRDLNWTTDHANKGSLFIGKGNEFWSDTELVFTYRFPDGSTAFSAAEGK